MRECKRVGRGSARHQEDRKLMLKNVGQLRLDPPRPRIISIGQCRALICPRNCGEDLRRDAGRVVTSEVHVFLGVHAPWE